jgi:DNA-binding response OmpR family regulator
MMRDTFRAVLEDDGFRVTLRDHASPNVTEIAQLSPDVVIVDSQGVADDCPEQLLRRMRAHADLACIPIVLCTGAIYDADALADELAELHVKLLPKPFDIDQLLAMVRA